MEEPCDFYMQFFSDFKYFRDNPAIDAPPVLRAMKDNVDLLEMPGGKLIMKLHKGAYLTYLDKSSAQMEYKGQKWLFLKVATSNKKIGWVWGYPDTVRDEGDE